MNAATPQTYPMLLELSRSWWLILLRGIAGIVFGILALVWYIGAYAIVFGILLVALSLRLRRHHSA